METNEYYEYGYRLGDEMETNEYYEYGYRLEDGTEAWQEDYGADGTWIRWNLALGISSIDIYNNAGNEKRIFAALEKAGVKGVVLRRLVVTITHPAYEIVP